MLIVPMRATASKMGRLVLACVAEATNERVSQYQNTGETYIY